LGYDKWKGLFKERLILEKCLVTTDISLGRDSQVFGMEYNVEKQNIGKEHSSTDSPRGSE
jgi:hypothetical protein